jgi:hypothetical protein
MIDSNLLDLEKKVLFKEGDPAKELLLIKSGNILCLKKSLKKLFLMITFFFSTLNNIKLMFKNRQNIRINLLAGLRSFKKLLEVVFLSIF